MRWNDCFRGSDTVPTAAIVPPSLLPLLPVPLQPTPNLDCVGSSFSAGKSGVHVLMFIRKVESQILIFLQYFLWERTRPWNSEDPEFMDYNNGDETRHEPRSRLSNATHSNLSEVPGHFAGWSAKQATCSCNFSVHDARTPR